MSRWIDADELIDRLESEQATSDTTSDYDIGYWNGLTMAKAIMLKQATVRLAPCDVCYLSGREDSRCLSCPAGPI